MKFDQANKKICHIHFNKGFLKPISFCVGYLWYHTQMHSGCKSISANDLQHCIPFMYPLVSLFLLLIKFWWLQSTLIKVKKFLDEHNVEKTNGQV